MSSLLLTGAGPSGAGTAFSPASVPGLFAWYDASTLGLADNAAVSTWGDMSGNGRDATQATGANQPTYKAAGVGGKPAVLFDGTNDSLAVSNTDALSQPNTVFVVPQLPAIPAGVSSRKMFDGITSRQLVQVVEGSGIYQYFAGGVANGMGATDTNPHVLAVVFNGASSAAYVDGTLITSLDSGSNALTRLILGTRNTAAGEFWPGYIAEFISYSGALSNANRDAVESYLGAKYGITVA